MRCPCCSRTLERVERDFYALEADALNAWEDSNFEGPQPGADKSTHWYCSNMECPTEGNNLREHHPLAGILSSPGDSFALSAVEGSGYPQFCFRCGSELLSGRDGEKSCTGENCTFQGLAFEGKSAEGAIWTLAWIK